LVEKGLVNALNLYTIRAGEYARDDIEDRLIRLSEEMIKIKGVGSSRACIYLLDEENRCSIYDNRPIECRELECWNTGAIEKMYRTDRLSRRDILSGISGLWDVVTDHQAHCSYAKVDSYRNAVGRAEKRAALQDIAGILRYDLEIRNVVKEQAGMDPGLLDFIFGRPMAEVLGISAMVTNA